MKKLKTGNLFILISFICNCLISNTLAIRGVAIVPVADLTLQKLKTLYSGKKLNEAYQTLSLEGTKKSLQSCPRTHQLLFNEQVEILRQEGNEILVHVPNCFYLAGGKKKSEYWTHKSNIYSLKNLKKRGLNTAKLPEPITHNKKKKKRKSKNSITLLLPFHDKKSKRTFSVGTRFVQAKPTTNNQFLIVWGLNPKGTKFEQLRIPRNICFFGQNYTNKKKRNLFVKLLKKWSNLSSQTFVPYVWGGCSFVKPYSKTCIKMPDKAVDAFKQKKQGIASGLDCSGAILRAAQAVDIPYFFKNSSTIFHNLKPVKNYCNLQDGDLLYTPGHIMMISNLKQNKIVEARSHWSGFGKLLETKLQDGFKDIKTFKQFFAQSQKGKRFCRINKEKVVSGKARTYTFLKLPV